MTSALFYTNGSSSQSEKVVTFGSTVNFSLVNTSGIDSVEWTILGVSHATVSATVTPVGKGFTASSVFPSDPGHDVSIIVKAVANNGIGADGKPDPALTCTRLIGTTTYGGFVLLSANETFERNAIVGWTEMLNGHLGTGGGSPGGGGGQTAQYYYSGVSNQALANADTLTQGVQRTALGFQVTLSPSSQYVYAAFPTSWGLASVFAGSTPLALNNPTIVTRDGVQLYLYRSTSLQTGTAVVYSVVPYTVATVAVESRVNQTLFVDPANYSATPNGSTNRPFQTIQAAIDYAVASSITALNVSLSPGAHAGAVTVPSSIDTIGFIATAVGICDALVARTSMSGAVTITENPSSHLAKIQFHGVRLDQALATANTTTGNLQIALFDAVITGTINAGYVAIRAAHSLISGAITAHAGSPTVALEVDRYTWNQMTLNGAPGNISPTPSLYLTDGEAANTGVIAIASTLHVDGTYGTPGGTGKLGDAINTIQGAINKASSLGLTNPIIRVTPGTYTEALTIPTGFNQTQILASVDGEYEWSATMPVTITGNITITKTADIAKLRLHGMYLNGNIATAGSTTSLALWLSKTKIATAIAALGATIVMTQAWGTLAVSSVSSAVAMYTDHRSNFDVTVSRGSTPVNTFLLSSSVTPSPKELFVVSGSQWAYENGTREYPYKTIQGAITQAAALNLQRPVISIAPGGYTENLTFPASFAEVLLRSDAVDVSSLAPNSPRMGVTISGTHTATANASYQNFMLRAEGVRFSGSLTMSGTSSTWLSLWMHACTGSLTTSSPNIAAVLLRNEVDLRCTSTSQTITAQLKLDAFSWRSLSATNSLSFWTQNIPTNQTITFLDIDPRKLGIASTVLQQNFFKDANGFAEWTYGEVQTWAPTNGVMHNVYIPETSYQGNGAAYGTTAQTQAIELILTGLNDQNYTFYRRYRASMCKGLSAGDRITWSLDRVLTIDSAESYGSDGTGSIAVSLVRSGPNNGDLALGIQQNGSGTPNGTWRAEVWVRGSGRFAY